MIKEFKIDSVTLKNRYVEGPMAGFTDLAMRTLAFEHGASLAYTEMISANALAYGSSETLDMVKDTQKDIGPVALQLFGSEIPNIKKAIAIVETYGKYTFLDFNLGCPVPKVMKQNAGSHLLKDLDYLYTLMKTIVETSHHPVIAKTRLGFSNPEDIVNIVKTLEAAGVKAIAIHGRTREEFYLGKPHYDSIAKAKEIATVPIIANGNIDVSNVDKVFAKVKPDAVMICRKALGHPTIFTDLLNNEEGKESVVDSFNNQKTLLLEHLRLEAESSRDSLKSALQMRAIAPTYFIDFPYARQMRTALVKCQTLSDYVAVLNGVVNPESLSGENNGRANV